MLNTPGGTTSRTNLLVESHPGSAAESTTTLTTNNTGTIRNLIQVDASGSLHGGNNNSNNHSIDPLRLSTSSLGVSPIPFGPTHMLLLYSEDPSGTGVYPKIVEVPICDVLVLAHCPNLVPVHSIGSMGIEQYPSSAQGSTSTSANTNMDTIFTRMSHKQNESVIVPRLLVKVHDLDTFAVFVVYMHTRNWVRLVREVVGERVWKGIR